MIKQVIKSLFEQVLEDLDDMTPRLVCLMEAGVDVWALED